MDDTESPSSSRNTSNISNRDASDSEGEYFIPKKRYKSSIQHGLSRSRARYHKARIAKTNKIDQLEQELLCSSSPSLCSTSETSESSSESDESTTSTSNVSTTSHSEEAQSTGEAYSPTSSDYETQEENVNLDKKIHEQTSHSIGTLYTAIMLFVIKHSLSRDAFSDLLALISSVMPIDSKFATSVYKVKETLKSVVGFKDPIIYKYCEVCQGLLQPGQIDCQNIVCRRYNSEVLEFYDLRLTEQLKNMFQDEYFCDMVRKTSDQTNEPGILEDLTDGSVYRAVRKPEDADVFLTFTMKTDGVALFKSSKKGNLWPVYMAINELPVTLRFSRKYLIPCYLFCQTEKPNMATYLSPLMETLNQLYQTGFDVVTDKGRLRVKAQLLAASLDLPARALVSNMKQFNGKTACSMCCDDGETVPGAPMHRFYPVTEPNVPRTHESMLRDAKEACRKGEAVNGIKGVSPLFALKYIDFATVFEIDWMHCVLLGVTKALMGFWLSRKNRNKDFYVGDKIDLLNKRLMGIQIPDFIPRRQRVLEEYSHWKATECREWLIHFSVPVLMGILKSSVFVHYLLFVSAMATLSRQSVSLEEIDCAEQLLVDFCAVLPEIYGETAQTMNMHMLRHLADNCRRYGPVFTHSCFGFESMNSYIKRMVHGTRHVNNQISFAVAMTKGLTGVVKKLTDVDTNEKIRILTLRLGSKFLREDTEEQDKEELPLKYEVVGQRKPVKEGSNIYRMLPEELRNTETRQLTRLRVNSVLFYSKEYSTAKTKNSHTIQFHEGDHQSFGEIECFVENSNSMFAVVKELSVKPFNVSEACQSNITHNTLNKYLDKSLCPHIFEVDNRKEGYRLVDIKFLRKKCVCMVDTKTFVSVPPNLLEHG